MNPRVIIICNEDEALLIHLIDELKQHDFMSIKVVHEQSNLLEITNLDFKGFIIFCLPQSELPSWVPYIKDQLLNFFKIYYYHSLTEENIDTSIFLYFDHLIAGKNKNRILRFQLDSLKVNYWRKIPLEYIGIEPSNFSMLLKKIILTLEKTDINNVTLDHISTKLNCNTSAIRQELKTKLNMQYSELKSSLINYYRDNYPDEFV